ncbi:hypothetical protein D3C85_1590320 [compost metagenome]
MSDGPDGIDGRLPPGDGDLVQRSLQHRELPLVGQHHLVDQGGFDGAEHVLIAGNRLVHAAQVTGQGQQQGGDKHQGTEQEGERGQHVVAPFDDLACHSTLYKISCQIDSMVGCAEKILIGIINIYFTDK